jgi:hypothetical protein
MTYDEYVEKHPEKECYSPIELEEMYDEYYEEIAWRGNNYN